MNGRAQIVVSFAHDFWNWWSDELKAMLPAKLKGEPTQRDRFDIYLGTDETVVETVVHGAGQKMVEAKPVDKLGEDCWEQIGVLAETGTPRLHLDGADYHIIPVTLPKASREQLASALSFQLPGLVPLEEQLIDWNFAELAREGGHVELALVLAKSVRLDAIETLFADHDLMPPTFCVRLEDQTIILRKPLEMGRNPFKDRRMQVALAVFAMLAMIPLLTIAGANIMSAIETDRSEKLEAELAPRLAGEKQILKEEMVRRAAAPLFRLPSASNRLESIARHLPDSDWTVTATQNPDSSFEFVADMKDRTAAEASLKKARQIRSLQPAAEINTENLRARVRYRVEG